MSTSNQKRHVIGGFAAGSSNFLVGHPFDTIKTRLQTNSAIKGPLDCLAQTVQKEGILALYKGSAPAFMGKMVTHAGIFGVRGFLTSKMQQRNLEAGAIGRLSLWQEMQCGGIAGLALAIVMTPADQIKVALQVQTNQKTAGRAFSGTMDCARRIMSTHGPLGLWRHWLPTSCEMALLATWFGSYHGVLRLLSRVNPRADEPSVSSSATPAPPPLHSLLAGGMAGVTMALVSQPVETVKSRLMHKSADACYLPALSGPPTSEGMLLCARGIYNKHQLAGFYRGLWPMVIRAFPTGAASFTGYELVGRVFFETAE